MKSLMLLVIGVAAMFATPAFGQTDLYNQTLFVYDDSWQSKAEWDDCRFCIPRVTVRWRALRHEMTLVVKGPNDQYVRNAVWGCMQEAVGAGVVAGLAAVYTGGAAMPVAWPAFKGYFFGCLSYRAVNAPIYVGIEDKSHWTSW